MRNASFTCFYRLPSPLLTNINTNQQACSVLLGDIHEKCSKWRGSNKNNTAGLQNDNTWEVQSNEK